MKISNYKKIIFLGSIFVILSLFVALLYISGFNKYSTIKFDDEVVAIKYTTLEKLPIDLNYTYAKVKYPVSDKTGTISVDGKFYFTVNYNKTDATPANPTVSVKMLLHCDWIKDYNYTGSSTIYNTPPSAGNFTISVKQKLPQSPLLFVKVTAPTLYIRVKITSNGTTTDYYIKDTKIMHNLKNVIVED
jgi:hypothetical protein